MNSNAEKEDELTQEQPDIFVRPWMLKFLPRRQGRRDLVMALGSLVLGYIVFVVLLNLFNYLTALVAGACIVGYFGELYLRRSIERWGK